MEERLEERFQHAIAELAVVSQSMKAPEAWRAFGDLAMEDFWRDWPEVRGWGEWLWQLIDNERRERSSPVIDEELDETGEGSAGG